jgi:SAM-dependent methyltransferase
MRARPPQTPRGRRTPPTTPPPARDAAVIWHEVECGAYSADLVLWEELVDQVSGPILDLGCGSGRVLLHLARRGHEIRGLDLEPGLVASLSDAEVGDARAFELAERFQLIVAPMQLVQLFAGTEQRKCCLRCVAAHLRPGGLAAFAIVESMPEPVDAAPPLPDTREVDGWVYSSLPLDAYVDADQIRVRRLRQTVSPAGELSEEVDEVVLQALDASTLETEAESVGLRPAGRRSVPPTEDHVGSTVVLLEKAG